MPFAILKVHRLKIVSHFCTNTSTTRIYKLAPKKIRAHIQPYCETNAV